MHPGEKKQPPRAPIDYVQAKLDSPASNKKLISNPEVNILLLQRHFGTWEESLHVMYTCDEKNTEEVACLDLIWSSKSNEVSICAAREELQLVVHVHIHHPGAPDFWCNSSKEKMLLIMFQNKVLIAYRA